LAGLHGSKNAGKLKTSACIGMNAQIHEIAILERMGYA